MSLVFSNRCLEVSRAILISQWEAFWVSFGRKANDAFVEIRIFKMIHTIFWGDTVIRNPNIKCRLCRLFCPLSCLIFKTYPTLAY